jgi:hypothetical protein
MVMYNGDCWFYLLLKTDEKESDCNYCNEFTRFKCNCHDGKDLSKHWRPPSTIISTHSTKFRWNFFLCMTQMSRCDLLMFSLHKRTMVIFLDKIRQNSVPHEISFQIFVWYGTPRQYIALWFVETETAGEPLSVTEAEVGFSSHLCFAPHSQKLYSSSCYYHLITIYNYSLGFQMKYEYRYC